jgi:hypothetical protein
VQSDPIACEQTASKLSHALCLFMCCDVLAATTPQQKLFQAVEEARALLAEGAACELMHQQRAHAAQARAAAGSSRATRRQQQLVQQQEAAAAAAKRDLALLTYPPPLRDDVGKSNKLLLKWLRGAAVDPEVRAWVYMCVCEGGGGRGGRARLFQRRRVVS